MADDKQRSGTRPHLVLHKNERRRKRSRPPVEASPPDVRIIDCRPDLYERLARHNAEWRWSRLVSALRELLFVVSAKIGRKARRNHNDN